MRRIALIVLDFQGDFEKDASSPILEHVLRLAEEVDVVIATQSMHSASSGHCVKGTKGARLNFQIKEEADYVATKGDDGDKGDFSAFQARTLRPLEWVEDILKEEGVEEVWVAGLGHPWDVPQTAYDANSLGYKTVVWKDATLGLSDYTQKRLLRAGIEIR